MRAARRAADPLWPCLCPAWTQSATTQPVRRALRSRALPNRTLHTTPSQPTDRTRRNNNRRSVVEYLERNTPLKLDALAAPHHNLPYLLSPSKHGEKVGPEREARDDLDLDHMPTEKIYTALRALAIKPDRYFQCREVAEYLIRRRRERPNVDIYHSLILSNANHAEGAAWRVGEYLEEMMGREGIQPDSGTCHAVLKVLAVHPDHLLRADVLEYMRRRWLDLSRDGWHDVVAGFWREGLYEKALEGMDRMRSDGVPIDTWLLDMAVFVLCEAGEISEAARTMRRRHGADEPMLSKSVWYALLDAASSNRHYAGTALAWNTQVTMGYINPASGICLNTMATAASAGDAVLATDVFTHLSKRGERFKPVHYESLVSCYLSSRPPDLQRALSVLTIMAKDRQEPSALEMRSLYEYLSRNPTSTVPRAFDRLRELSSGGRNVPIAALNVLIEAYVEKGLLQPAIDIYKQVHEFAPTQTEGKRTFATIETFNLLLKGCRMTTPPDVPLANFLVAELHALRLKPDAITFDRLILVFLQAAAYALTKKDEIEGAGDRAKELAEWAYRHFRDMQPQGWTLRTGTIAQLALQLARLSDARCWDVLQIAEDRGAQIEGWAPRRHRIRNDTEKAWGEQDLQRDVASVRDESLTTSGLEDAPKLGPSAA